MGTRNPKGSVSIEKFSGRIRLRWRYQKKRYVLYLFHFSKNNLLQAKKVALRIETDMVSGRFDGSLDSYRPDNKQAEIYHPQKGAASPHFTEKNKVESLVDCFQSWVKNYRNMDCDTDIDYNSTRSMMIRWGAFTSENAVERFNNETFGAKTYNRRLNLLKAFFNWMVKSKKLDVNPFEDVLPKKTRKTTVASRKPFTEDEIKRILKAFQEDLFTSPSSGVNHSHYYPFVYFIFQTGVRNAEAVGLRVQHIDLEAGLIHIKEVLARTLKGTNPGARIRKETKNGKHRVLPLSENLKEILLPLIQKRKADDLVFESPRGKAIDDNQFQKRIFSKVLRELNIEHRVLYACRHTFSSRCIQNGINPVTTAFLMGNNPETALRNYTHLLSLPNNLPKIT